MKRSQSLDALRGLAMLLMVLSGSIAFGGVLPGWMYHAQIPPPNHVFDATLPGITWVDLVFPFFLFSMGAAFPLALKKKMDTQPLGKTLLQIIQRALLLVFFAIFTLHARAWVMDGSPTAVEHLLSIGCFIVLFLIYTQGKGLVSKRVELIAKIAGFSLAALFLAFYPFKNGFSLSQSDIIIIVLANMALFGSVIWIFTRNKPLYRIAILPFVMAVFLASKETESWNSLLFNWSPAPWMYKFYYLKYLFIIIPGTFAGEWLAEKNEDLETKSDSKSTLLLIAAGCFVLLLTNLIGLFERILFINLLVTIAVSVLIIYQAKSLSGSSKSKISKFLKAGVYLLLLGLSFEAYEGGIKKDFSTYSYYFVTSGLAFLTLLSLIILEQLGYFASVFRFLGDNGKNPMVTYTAGNLLLIPLLKLTGAQALLDSLNGNAVEGLLRGLIFTGIVALITVLFTRIKFFWKT